MREFATLLIFLPTAFFLNGCGEGRPTDDQICRVEQAIDDGLEMSRYERFVAILEVIDAFEATVDIYEDTRVYTILGFHAMDGAVSFVAADCADVIKDVRSLGAIQNARPGDPPTSYHLNSTLVQFTQLSGASLFHASEALSDNWNMTVRQECLIKAELEFRSSDALSEADRTIYARDLLREIIMRNPQYGVPILQHLIYNNTMVAALRAHCDRREEALSFLFRYWVETHTDELRAHSISDMRLNTTVDGLTLDDLSTIPAWAGSEIPPE